MTTFAAAPVDSESQQAKTTDIAALEWSDSPLIGDEKLPVGAKVKQLSVQPSAIDLKSPFDYSQLLISATLETGDIVDVTRMATIQHHGNSVDVSKSGFVKAKVDGAGKLAISFGGQAAEIPVKVAGVGQPFVADFIRDVNPVLARVGCNQGTCHGAKDGKNGFKLSLRGYDPIYDIRAFTDDLAARRTNIASPRDSLMLLKATGVVPHVGGQVVKATDNYYEILRNWVSNGAKLKLDTPKVTSISISPENPVIQRIDSTQQIRIVATFADGSTKDVTREAFINSGNTEVAVTNRWGLMTAVRRGEAPILARFEGAYAATTLTVMGNRDGFEWRQPETWNDIDDFVAAKWQRMKIQPSGLCTDAEYLRRVYLDLTGLPPTAEEVRAFLADNRETQVKRSEVVDRSDRK